MKYLLYSFALIIFLSSCRPKNIDLEITSAEPKLVVFTHVIPDNIMIVAVTKSFSALDGTNTSDINKLIVSGAKVQMKLGSQTFEFYELKPGIYSSYEKAYLVNENYELIVSFGGDTVRSITKMLPKVEFASIVPIVEKQTSDTTIFIDITFDDIPSISNWYLINIYKKKSNSDFDGVNFFTNGSNSATRCILVSDQEFNNTYHNKLELSGLRNNDSIVVTLSNINEEYFNYLGYRTSTGNVFNQVNLEPVNYPTNITNGYGFFNIHSPDIYYFDLKNY